MSKPVVLTGLRANNDLHIGNYLGALLPMVDMATQRAGEYQVNLFVPDLHSFTTPIDHSTLQAGIMQNLRVFVAAGLPLNNPDIHIYRQSCIPAHSELAIILNSFTGFGEMSRMTQFKDKSKKIDLKKIKNQLMEADQRLFEMRPRTQRVVSASGQVTDIDTKAHFDEVAIKNAQQALRSAIATLDFNDRLPEFVTVGLFDYPVLMAADILLYGSAYVPVGDDQTQHIEFTRDIAERMNSRFGELFAVPKPVKEQHEFFGKDQGLRVRDLADPAKKMSKSDETGKGVIFLTDSADVARKKIMSATTDSHNEVQHDYKERPGVSNLLDILKLLGGNPDEFIGQTQYGPLKTAVADRVTAFLADFQAKLAAVDEQALLAKLAEDEARMNEVANAKLLEVQKAVGLRP